MIRDNWTLDQVREIYNRPLIDLISDAVKVHREYHNPRELQISTLINIKSGGCPEDCAYCPQAARYSTKVNSTGLMTVDEVMTKAQQAKDSGSSRVCMGAAWRNVKDGPEFDQVLDMVRGINTLDMEVCCTLGMVTERQAERLADAGLYAYNHNLDTSEEHYKDIISTRAYEDRLSTIENVRKTNITVCSGGIIGMGESIDDRCGMLVSLSRLSPHPESLPINTLVAVEGTPLEEQSPVSIWELVRMIATARLVLPHTVLRLSAGRTELSPEGHALCYLVGAGSIFAGEQLLTTDNPDQDADMALLNILGIQPVKPFKRGGKPQVKQESESKPALGEKPKWTRPKHEIERNLEKSKKAIKTV